MRLPIVVSLGLALTLALSDGGMAASKRGPFDGPRLTPRYPPGAVSRSEPWKLKEPNAYGIRQPSYPYASKRARAHVSAQVRDYERARRPATPKAQPSRAARARAGNCYFSDCR